MSKKLEDDPPKSGFTRFVKDDTGKWISEETKIRRDLHKLDKLADAIYEKEVAKMLAADAKAFEKLVAETPTETLHDLLRYGSSKYEAADMAKIDADLSKVRDARPSFVRDKEHRLYEAAERLKETAGLDPKSKSVLDDLLGAVRASRTPKTRPGERAKSFAEAEAEARLRREREERARYEREKLEAFERERERLAKEKRERDMAEAEVREAEAREYRKREYEARKKREAEEAVRENKTRIMREWGELMAQERAGVMYDLKQETANVSVNTGKACIIVRCAITPKLAHEMLSIKGVKLTGDVFECTSEAMKSVKPLLVATFKDVQMIGVPKALPATKFDKLMAKLSKEDRAAIYKLLARKYHTDVGGSHEMMVLINSVFKES